MLLNIKNKLNIIDVYLCIFLFVFAFLLRLNYFSSLFTSSDNTAPVLYGMRLVLRPIFSLNFSDNPFLEIIAYPYGFNMFFYYIFLLVVKFFNFFFNEFIAPLPLIFFGSLKIVFIYKIVREYVDLERLKGFFIAFFFAVFPYFILRDYKFIQMQMICPSTIFVIFLYYFLKFQTTHGKKFFYLSSLFCAIYIVSSNLNPGIFVFLCFLLLYFYKKDGKLNFNWTFFILPILFILPYIAVHLFFVFKLNDSGAGFLGKLMAKSKQLGFYLYNFIHIFIDSYGKFFGVIFLIFLFLGIPYTFLMYKNLKKKIIFYVWSLIYYLPFLLLIAPGVTLTHTYLYEGTTAIILSIFIFIDEIIPYKKVVYVIFSVFIFISIINSHIFNNKTLDDGLKAAGYLVRNQINEDKKIYIDTEPMRSHYYLGREKIYCKYDADFEANLNYLINIYINMDILILEKGFKEYVAAKASYILDSFDILYVLEREGREIRYILAKNVKKFKRISIIDYNNNFDKEFGKIGRIISYPMKWPADNAIMPEENL